MNNIEFGKVVAIITLLVLASIIPFAQPLNLNKRPPRHFQHPPLILLPETKKNCTTGLEIDRITYL